ncbi:MAG: hypothetical protein ACRD9Q_02390 [Nitrososphaeraceae archaeon]
MYIIRCLPHGVTFQVPTADAEFSSLSFHNQIENLYQHFLEFGCEFVEISNEELSSTGHESVTAQHDPEFREAQQ